MRAFDGPQGGDLVGERAAHLGRQRNQAASDTNIQIVPGSEFRDQVLGRDRPLFGDRLPCVTWQRQLGTPAVLGYRDGDTRALSSGLC